MYLIQFSSVTQSCLILCDSMDCSTPGFSVHHQLPELIQTHVYRVGDVIQPSHPLSSPSPPAFNLSQHQGLLKWVSSSHQVAKVFGFQLQHQSFQWIFRTDFLKDWLVGSPCSPRDVQECSTPHTVQKHWFISAQLYSPTLTSIQDYDHGLWYMTGKMIALTRRIFVGKVMLLLFNMLSRLVITFLPRNKRLLISWLQSPSAVILEPKKIKSLTVSIVSPTICHEVMGPNAIILVFECWVLRQFFHSPLSLSSRGSLVLLCFLP